MVLALRFFQLSLWLRWCVRESIPRRGQLSLYQALLYNVLRFFLVEATSDQAPRLVLNCCLPTAPSFNITNTHIRKPKSILSVGCHHHCPQISSFCAQKTHLETRTNPENALPIKYTRTKRKQSYLWVHDRVAPNRRRKTAAPRDPGRKTATATPR